MKPNRLTHLLVLAAVLAGVVVVVLLRQGGPADPDIAPPPDIAADARSTDRAERSAMPGPFLPTVNASAPAPAAPAGPGPLPPDRTPLVSMLPQLLARLDAGDVRAGCRLYRELRRCHSLQSMRELAENAIEQAVQPETADDQVEHVAQVAAFVDARTALATETCADVDARMYGLYHDAVLRSARLGDTRAMVEYADSAGSLDLEFVREPGRLNQWRTQAEGLLYEALERGEPAALFVLRQARSSDDSLIAALLDNDPVEAAAVSMVMDRIGPAPVPWAAPLLRGLDAQEVVRAEAMADRLLSSSFAAVAHQPANLMLDTGEPDMGYCDRL